MKKTIYYILFVSLFINTAIAQVQSFPIFNGCEGTPEAEMETCFKQSVKDAVLEDYNVPEIVAKNDFKGVVNVLFYVDRKGSFVVIPTKGIYEEIEAEVQRIFNTFLKTKPAQFDGRAVEMNFAVPLHFPDPKLQYGITENEPSSKDGKKQLTKFQNRKFLEHQSNLNIPFNHTRYAFLENGYSNAENTHTAVKPFLYKDVVKYVDLDAQKKKFLKKKKTWLGRKFWNEHLAVVKGDDFWFTADMLLNVEFGKDNSDVAYTYINSRILQVQGELGKKLAFSATIYETQGRFSDYVNQGINLEELKTFDSDGLVFGRGKAKQFKQNSYDFPVSEGYLSFTPNEFFNIQVGQGKNFIGNGYRSLLLSDVASPYPYAKLTTKFWKFQYTNLWMWMTDIRLGARIGDAHPRKYVSSHYLSININKKLNIGFYEAVMTNNDRTGTLDMDFINPLIFYKSLEFARGEDAGSAVLGINANYKFSKKFSMYSQFVLDEFTLEEIKAQDGYWANKYGFQLGAKYFDAFKIDNLYLQGEFNWVRPYTFSHKTPIFNYGHYGESLAHSWGANFWEAIGIARYQKGRWAANIKVVLGEKGFDPIPLDPNSNFGGDIFKSSNALSVGNNGNEVGQGIKTMILNSNAQVSYLINPRTDLKVFGSLTYRKFSPETPTATYPETNITWFSLGVKVDLFNWYLDF